MRLWRNNPETRGGKYLVERVTKDTPTPPDGWPLLPHPGFVIGARDPAAVAALRAYGTRILAMAGKDYVGQIGSDRFRILRRDGTVPEWPGVVLHAADPHAPVALRAYCAAANELGLDAQYIADLHSLAIDFEHYYDVETLRLNRLWDDIEPEVLAQALEDFGPRTGVPYEAVQAYGRRVMALADEFEVYRRAHGSGDPDAPRHRRDDPATIARMEHSRSQ